VDGTRDRDVLRPAIAGPEPAPWGFVKNQYHVERCLRRLSLYIRFSWFSILRRVRPRRRYNKYNSDLAGSKQPCGNQTQDSP
jgi:hypothetical protein